MALTPNEAKLLYAHRHRERRERLHTTHVMSIMHVYTSFGEYVVGKTRPSEITEAKLRLDD